MEDYKSNSLKSKEDAAKEERKVEKVISAGVTTRKKSEMRKFTDEFISEDVANVKNYILLDVLIPAIKKAISDIVVNGIDMILYGETGHTHKSNGSKPSYRSYYDEKNSTNYSKPSYRTVYSFDDICLENRGDAEEVLDGMIDILDKYGMVSVADMYDLVGITGNYTDNKYGWLDLRSAGIDRNRDGSYSLRLPKVVPLK